MLSANKDCIKMIFAKSSLRLRVFRSYFVFITRAKGSARKAQGKRECCFFDFFFSLFEPITRASRWPPFAAGYVNERITKDKTNAVRVLLQGNPQVIF